LRQSIRRYEFATSFVPVLGIAALWIPLQAVLPIAQVLAGRNTTVNFTITIAVSVILGGTLISNWWRNKQRGRELVRLREENAELEAALRAAEGRAP
jgi:hypothetical protein